ncbi:MAG: hypothetical protein LBC56_00735 [Oscillospiraceae bacterium]|jgi:hypothetical protein|nr:hypothetical protein [Oscillospiraceae bacterium]
MTGRLFRRAAIFSFLLALCLTTPAFLSADGDAEIIKFHNTDGDEYESRGVILDFRNAEPGTGLSKTVEIGNEGMHPVIMQVQALPVEQSGDAAEKRTAEELLSYVNLTITQQDGSNTGGIIYRGPILGRLESVFSDHVVNDLSEEIYFGELSPGTRARYRFDFVIDGRMWDKYQGKEGVALEWLVRMRCDLDHSDPDAGGGGSGAALVLEGSGESLNKNQDHIEDDYDKTEPNSRHDIRDIGTPHILLPVTGGGLNYTD